MPLSISVIIPTYNRARLIARALASALANIEPGDEILVVDDGSTDDTAAVLATFGDRIRVIAGRHAGAGAARNTGIAAARGGMVAFLDSDDEWVPGKLALHRGLFAARPELLFSFTDFAVHTANGEVRPRYLSEWHHDPRSWDEILGPGVLYSNLVSLPTSATDFRVHIGDLYPQLLRGDYVATFTVVTRRLAAGANLRFAEDIPLHEDSECFARLARSGQAAYLDVETARNHGHDGPRITDIDLYRGTSARLTMLERVWGSDAAFLAGHRDAYDRRRAELYHMRARWLLSRGRTREARDDLRHAGAAPLPDRMLAALPGFVARGVFGARRLLRGRSV